MDPIRGCVGVQIRTYRTVVEADRIIKRSTWQYSRCCLVLCLSAPEAHKSVEGPLPYHTHHTAAILFDTCVNAPKSNSNIRELMEYQTTPRNKNSLQSCAKLGAVSRVKSPVAPPTRLLLSAPRLTAWALCPRLARLVCLLRACVAFVAAARETSHSACCGNFAARPHLRATRGDRL